MKKLVFMILLVVLSIAAFGQSVDNLSSKESPRIPAPSLVAEIELRDNGWGRTMEFYETPGLLSILGQLFQEELDIALGMNTREMMEEGYERDQLAASKWVAPSPRLQERTLEPATIRLVVTTGGSYTDHGRSNYSVGGYSVSTEGGTSTAFIAVSAYGLVTGRQLWSVRGEAKYHSTNIDDVSLSGLFRKNRWARGVTISFERYRNNPSQVRGLISTSRAFEDVIPKLRAVRSQV